MKKTVTKTVEYTYECYESDSDNLLDKMIADAKADVGLVNKIESHVINFVRSNCSLDEFLEEIEKDSQYMSKIIKLRVEKGLL